MKKLTLLLAASLIAAPIAFAASNDGGQNKGGKGHGGKGEMRIMRQLDLSDEQQSQIKEIMQTQRDQRQAGKKDFSEMQAYHAQHMAVVSSVQFDEAAAKALIDQQLEKQSERKLASLKVQHEVFQVLTPEQQAKYQELQSEQMQNMQDKMEKRQAGKGNGKGKASN